MASSCRNYIAKKIVRAIAKDANYRKDVVDPHILSWCVRVAKPTRKSKSGNNSISLVLPHLHLRAAMADSVHHPDRLSHMKWVESFTSQMETCSIVNNVEVIDKAIVFTCDHQKYIQETINDIHNEPNYGLSSSIHRHKICRHTSTGSKIVPQPTSERVVVEYSSPNIAKPFHAGHLRSTIIGNYIANINEALGHRVVRLNWLGDWGTQFGLLGVGMKKYGSAESLEENAIKHLYDVYVKINKDVSEEENGNTHQQAMDLFSKMEQGDGDALSFWERLRKLSIEEYCKVYQRLGVEFDEYQGEAMYHKPALDVVAKLKDSGLLQFNCDTGVGYIDLSCEGKPTVHSSIVRSDGSTLYITRDIAAALDRLQKYKFDRMHYVVENGQHSHFYQLKHILEKLEKKWETIPLEQMHVKFGRVEGMSTRKGTAVFLEDILNEAKSEMYRNMQSKSTTKVTDGIENVADVLGVSAVIVQDLKEMRLHNYKFSWDRMLKFQGRTGVYLQYTHARLCSLEKNSGAKLDLNSSLECLNNPEAIRLCQHLGAYDQAIHTSFVDMEACHLVHYLFHLCQLVGTANEVLQIKGQAEEIGKARLLLFHSARKVLRHGMKLVGLQPLDMI